MLVEFVQTHGSKVPEIDPTLRRLKDDMEGVRLQVVAQDNNMLQLEQLFKRQDQHMQRQDARIEVLEQNSKRADATRAKERQRILLGQAAMPCQE